MICLLVPARVKLSIWFVSLERRHQNIVSVQLVKARREGEARVVHACLEVVSFPTSLLDLIHTPSFPLVHCRRRTRVGRRSGGPKNGNGGHVTVRVHVFYSSSRGQRSVERKLLIRRSIMCAIAIVCLAVEMQRRLVSHHAPCECRYVIYPRVIMPYVALRCSPESRMIFSQVGTIIYSGMTQIHSVIW